uniref:Bicarbonate transporter-like transmembrane domain-containing protein n=1 Tax=Panagrolaimus sp. ES5 TaxID=591445 RepID=A0AC34GNC1_9BILA
MNLPTNFGPGLGDVQFILLVIAPMKGTKTAFETSRTFSTLLCDPALRQRLLDAHNKAHFIQEINITVGRMAFQLSTHLERKIEKVVHKKERWWPCKGIINDSKRRKQCYISDYTDGFCDTRVIQKTISSAVFLYFAILPTAIVLGIYSSCDNKDFKACSTHDPLACGPSVGLLFVLLLCGTLWIRLTLYNFRTTPFLTKTSFGLCFTKWCNYYDIYWIIFLKKGAAANWDLLIVAFMNVVLSILGLLLMHEALPQAFLHLKAQADIEDRLVDGILQQIVVKNRESRLATLIAHGLMIPTYFFLFPFLQLIPTAVFHGLFLYLAFTSMVGNELCERALLLFTEQHSYSPLHYIRRVPQKTVHAFTLFEIVQLAILYFAGFSPWPVVEMIFPIITFLFIPFRSLLLPYIFNEWHLEALDSVH